METHLLHHRPRAVFHLTVFYHDDVTLTQSQDTQADDDLFAGGDAGDQTVQHGVIANKSHHGLGKLRITGNVQRRAAVKHRQRLTGDTQGSEVPGVGVSDVQVGSVAEVKWDVPGRDGKFGTLGEPLRQSRIFMSRQLIGAEFRTWDRDTNMQLHHHHHRHNHHQHHHLHHHHWSSNGAPTHSQVSGSRATASRLTWLSICQEANFIGVSAG